LVCGQLFSSLFFFDFHRTNFSGFRLTFPSFDPVGFAIFATSLGTYQLKVKWPVGGTYPAQIAKEKIKSFDDRQQSKLFARRGAKILYPCSANPAVAISAGLSMH
jgi:hypothetical protein